ncbi:hypothetical protein H5410_055805 [Solanum commersonii]|uniref:Ferric reductase NAD binding domain-containing protein n=1 Tax=Solanum commersonii TaxID=4109 RepID=A0A9J5WK84_SOLCO|nr:hypothetical protein H5410_055805 [Solanum commersonii]
MTYPFDSGDLSPAHAFDTIQDLLWLKRCHQHHFVLCIIMGKSLMLKCDLHSSPRSFQFEGQNVVRPSNAIEGFPPVLYPITKVFCLKPPILKFEFFIIHENNRLLTDSSSVSALYYQVKSPSFHLAEQLRPLDLQAVCCFAFLGSAWELLNLIGHSSFSKSGGPVVREWQQKLLEWQLAHPSGSTEESLDWMKWSYNQKYQKPKLSTTTMVALVSQCFVSSGISRAFLSRFGGNELFKNELNQDIPLEKKIEDLYTDDIPLLPSLSTLSFDATVKLKLYQANTAGWGKNILGESHRSLTGVLDWHLWLTHRRQKCCNLTDEIMQEIKQKRRIQIYCLTSPQGKLARKKFIHQNGLLSRKRQRRDDTSYERDFTPIVLSLLIDGPYRSHDYKKYDVVLLVHLGIGATPLICIVKDVLNNIKQQKDISDGLVESGHKGSKRSSFATKHAYFYWVTREQGSFEWFKGVNDDA